MQQPPPSPYGPPQPPYSQPPQYGGQYGPPPQWGPPPGPPQDPRPWHQRHRKLVIWGGVIAGLAVIGSIGQAAGAGSPAADTSTAVTRTAPAPHAGAPKPAKAKAGPAAAADCLTQARDWANGGATTQMGSIGADLTAFSTAATTFAGDLQTGTAGSGDTAGVQSAAASMQSDAQALEDNPAPSCIPGMRADLAAGTGDLSKSGINAENAMDQYTAGDSETAAADIDAADGEMTAGSGKIGDATADLKRFENG